MGDYWVVVVSVTEADDEVELTGVIGTFDTEPAALEWCDKQPVRENTMLSIIKLQRPEEVSL